MTVICHTIMCGGSGTRLWPWSRKSYPKQFLSFIGDRSLLQATIGRLDGFDATIETIAIGNEEHRFLIAEQFRQTGADRATIVLEPEGRNTAPLGLVAALHAQSHFGSDALVLLSPADHHIGDVKAYRAAIAGAVPTAQAGRIVTFGIAPTQPETGYGYIEMGEPLGDRSHARAIKAFHEKPDLETATAYIAHDDFVWNAGIFLFSAGTLIDLAKELKPEMLELCRSALERAQPDLDFLRLDADAYRSVEAISFDYAFAEHMGPKGAIVPTAMGWSDIGSWRALKQTLQSGGDGSNVLSGPGEVYDCTGTLVMSDGPLVVAHGLTDTIVVANCDAIYVAPADRSQEIKAIVEELERSEHREAVSHQRVHRPWGWYQTINSGNRFQVKEIVVHPGGTLSLQAHYHRAEHWVVVRGTARVTIDDQVRIVGENESVFVPLGSRHRLENPGQIPMHLIEVQTGSYLEEDDIIRFDDIYGRV